MRSQKFLGEMYRKESKDYGDKHIKMDILSVTHLLTPMKKVVRFFKVS